MTDSELFTLISKLVKYIRAFIELKKIYATITKNPYNIGIYQMIKISSILRCVYVIYRNQDMVVFYLYNYIE